MSTPYSFLHDAVSQAACRSLTERLANIPVTRYDAGMSDLAQSRLYYSARRSGSQAMRLDLDTLKTLFDSVYSYLQTNGFFDEAFGSFCVDAGDIDGMIGSNVEAYVLFKLMKKNIWPIHEKLEAYNEADLFDVIEFLFDHVSEPQQKDYHSWNNCGYHYSDFDKAKGQQEYRNRINPLLARYGEGYELTDKGELMVVASTFFGRSCQPKMQRSLRRFISRWRSSVVMVAAWTSGKAQFATLPMCWNGSAHKSRKRCSGPMSRSCLSWLITSVSGTSGRIRSWIMIEPSG